MYRAIYKPAAFLFVCRANHGYSLFALTSDCLFLMHVEFPFQTDFRARCIFVNLNHESKQS